jgi:osmotically inducible protein OsmC
MNRTANAHWTGTLMEGTGELGTQSTVLNNTPYSFKTRFADGIGTNPEELIGAALAGCYSMSLSAALEHEGFKANEIFTSATVDLDIQALRINGIHLELRATLIDGVDSVTFKAIAEGAKAYCIISKALSLPVTLNVTYA